MSLHELLHDVAEQATGSIGGHGEAAATAVRGARRRRRRRILGGVAVVALALLTAYALVPGAPGMLRRTVPAVTPGPDRLPTRLEAPPPWLPDLQTQPIGPVGLVASDSTGWFVVSADGQRQARLDADLVDMSADGAVLAWAAGTGSCDGTQATLSWYLAATGSVRTAVLTPDGSLGGYVDRVRVAPDGAHLLAEVVVTTRRDDTAGCVGQGRLKLLDAATGATTDYAPQVPSDMDPLAWDADSATITFSADDAPYVGGPNHAARCDLSGRVLDRFTVSREPSQAAAAVGIGDAASLRWTEGTPAQVWEVALVPGRHNQARSYDTSLRDVGAADVVGERAGADVLAVRPFNGLDIPDGGLVAVREGTVPVTLLTAPRQVVSVIDAASGVVADAQLGGPGPAAPSVWSLEGVQWWLRTYGGLLVGCLVLVALVVYAARWLLSERPEPDA